MKLLKLGVAFILTCTLSITANAGEIQIGKGTIDISGGFVGLDKTIFADITTYTIAEQHKNLFSTTWFYTYDFTWYDSKTITQGQSSFNSFTGLITTPIVSPTIDYRPQGLDINIGLGKDLIHKDERNFMGLSLMLGLSTPWIDSSKSSSNNDSTSNSLMNTMKKSKTKILTYKIGPSIAFRKSVGQYFSFYGDATYAYQTGSIKNSYTQSDFTANGIFQKYDAGIRFDFSSHNKKISFITFSPRLYATLGYKYTSWKLNNINLDVSGANFNFTKSDFKMNTSTGYFGIGYSF